MKNLSTVFVFMLAVLCFSLSLVAGEKSIVDGKLIILKAAEAPTIDGVLDPVWDATTATPMVKYEGHSLDSVGNFHDHSSNFRLLWDEGYFYAFVSVVDDSLDGSEKASPWNSDCIEMFFDGNNGKTTSYETANDVQWRYVYGETPAAHPGGNGRGEYAFANTPTGYSFEIRIPKDSLLNNFLVADQEIGFEISNADRDGGHGQETVLHWWTNNGLTWQNTALFGTALLSSKEANSTINIPYTDTPPTIDGDMAAGEWDIASELSMARVEGGRPLDSIITSWKDHGASFWTMWNENYFCVFANVVDDSLDGSEKASPWNSDCIEIFFDGNNGKTTSYETANDVQWRYVYGETPAAHPGGNGRGEYLFKNTSTGYNFELRIPKDSLLNNFLVSDMNIGFEISNADRDGGHGQESVLHWWTTNGLTWQNTALFGTALLSGVTTGVERNDHSVVTSYELGQNYPNPFNPSTNITFALPKSERVKLAVYNLLGKEVAVLANGVRSAGPHMVSFNAGNLASGVYFYKLQTESTLLTKKMVFIK